MLIFDGNTILQHILSKVNSKELNFFEKNQILYI